MLLLPSCEGIMAGVYDEPADGEEVRTAEGQLYVDASDWSMWYYLDLPALAESVSENPDYNTSSAWVPLAVPAPEAAETSEVPQQGTPGVYTYWYDVYGAGVSRFEYRAWAPAERQPEPESWSIAVHRNNLRTNGGAITRTDCDDIDALPLTHRYLETLEFSADEWNETDVWINQDRMLAGIIGNQGIEINRTGSAWLRIDIPPMPPAFTIDRSVLVLRLADGSYGALQLRDYQSAAGVKCCLTISYRYPIVFK